MSQTETEARVTQDAYNLSSFWRERNGQLERWYTLRRLVDRWKKENLTSFVSADPKVYFNLARHMLASNPPRVRVMEGDDPLGERQANGITEAAVHSIIRGLDERQRRQGLLPWRVALADQILMGWVNVFLGVFRNPDGSPEFRGDIWDNFTVYPEWDDLGLVTVVHQYTVSPLTAQAKARHFQKSLDLPQTSGGAQPASVRVIDWWHRDRNRIVHALTIGGQEVLPFTEEEALSQIPVLCLPIGGEARREREVAGKDPATFMFASILDPMERTISDLNEWLTIMKNIALRNLRINFVDFSPDAQGVAEQSDLETGAGIIHAAVGEDIKALQPPTMPAEAGLILNFLERQRQKGSVPDTAFADVAADTSGFLFSQLQAAALNNVGPYNEAQDFMLSAAAQTWIEGFRDGGFQPIRIRARASVTSNESGFFFRQWKPKDVPDPVWVDVHTQLAFMRNRMQEIATMRQANPGAKALLDMTTLLDEIGGFEDPLLIQQRLMEDEVRNSPNHLAIQEEIFYRQMADTEERRGNVNAAAAYRMKADLLAQVLLAPGAQAMQGGGAAPPEAGGVMGQNGQSPDLMRALLQRPPPQMMARQGR